MGNTSRKSFPPCNQTLNETVFVNKSHNAFLSIELNIEKEHSHIRAEYTWMHGKGDVICTSPGGGECHGVKDSRFHMQVGGNIFPRGVPEYNNYIFFELTIDNAIYDDNGFYFVVSNYQDFCTILRMNVIVRDTPPSCTALLESVNTKLRLSCGWIPREDDDQMDLTISRNGTHKLYEKYKVVTGAKTIKKSWNSEKVISATVALHDIFDDDLIPDACNVSEKRQHFEKHCEFSIFMSPQVSHITEYEHDVSFICCADGQVPPIIWRYNNCSSMLMPVIMGQTFKVDEAVCSQGPYDNNASVVFICGKEEDGETVVLGIGKVTKRFEREPIMFIPELNSYSGLSNSGQNCENAYIFSLTVPQPSPEHVTWTNTPDPETKTYLKTFSNTPDTDLLYQPITYPYTSYGQSEIHSAHFNITQSTLPPSKQECAHIFKDRSIEIFVLLILIISLLCNVWLGCEKCYRQIQNTWNITIAEKTRERNISDAPMNARNMDDMNEALQMETLEHIQVSLHGSCLDASTNTEHQREKQELGGILRGVERGCTPQRQSDKTITLSSPTLNRNTTPTLKGTSAIEEKTLNTVLENRHAFPSNDTECYANICQNCMESKRDRQTPKICDPVKHSTKKNEGVYSNFPDCLYAKPDEPATASMHISFDTRSPSCSLYARNDTTVPEVQDYANPRKCEENYSKSADEHIRISDSITSTECMVNSLISEETPEPTSQSHSTILYSDPISPPRVVSEISACDYDCLQRPYIEEHFRPKK